MPDPLRFDVSNPQTPDAGAVIYISDDADKWGRLDITLTNTSTDNSDLKLDPGGVLQIYLEMLTPDDIKNITLPADSPWAGGPDTTHRHLELHPRQTITIPSQSSISIELHNVLGHAARQGKFRFYDASLGIRNAVVQGFVQQPPAGDAGQWGLACNLVSRVDYQSRGDTIYVTGSGTTEITNYLVIELYHQAGGTLPSAGTPQLSVSFLTGDDELALCSEDQLKKVAASIANQEPDGRWKTPAVDAQGQDTVWTVSPVDGGGDLFPADGVLTLRFDGIVTDLPAGGTAAMFIQYSGLSGYDDGYLVVLLNKTAPVPYLRSFVAYYDNAKVGTGATAHYGALKLGWEVFAADHAVLRDETVGPSSDQVLGATDATTVQAVTAQVSYRLAPRAAGVDHPEDGGTLDLLVALPTAKLEFTQDVDGAVAWQCTEGSHCALSRNGVLLADNLPLVGQHPVTVPPYRDTTCQIQCFGIGTATATVVSLACWNIIAQLGGTRCDPNFCETAAEYIAAFCNCHPPYQNGCQNAPSPDCCVFSSTSPVPVPGGNGVCFCCCGDRVTVNAVALATESKAAHEIEIGDKVRAALDGRLSQWAERPVQFSAGIGADPARPMIEIRFGDAADAGTILATRNQLFLMPGGVLKRAARLAAGRDVLVRADGATAPIVAMEATKALRGVHQIATSRDPATDLGGHLIVVNGIVCGDYALQLSDLDSIRPELMATGHVELPEFGTDRYAAVNSHD
jgi:hypothetical protein